MTSMVFDPKSQDGPTTAFLPDPFVSDDTCEATSYHGIVINTMWPPPDDLVRRYHESLLPQIRACFDDIDVPECDALSEGTTNESDTFPGNETNHDAGDGDDGKRKAIAPFYLYPGANLHVSVATLHPLVKRDASTADFDAVDDGDGELHAIANQESKWNAMLQLAASQHHDWPTQELQFEIDSAQIGRKAGILLWRETTGGVQRIRRCLADTVAANSEGLRIHSMPDIIHSTFLRFRSVPKTDAAIVQRRFKTNVLPKLKETFPFPITAKWIKVVCKWTRYLNISDDERHAHLTMRLEQGVSCTEASARTTYASAGAP